ncbi:MAG: SIR2 family protein [Anaerolineales bacterium]|nr:SIR2 family protein [Anaerolineales bacterium]
MTGILKRLPKQGSQTEGSETGPFWPDTRRLIDTGAITPLISNYVTAAAFNVQPGDIAASWADEINSPLSAAENRDLAAVAQFYAVHLRDAVEAKRQYLEALKGYLVAAAKDDSSLDPDLISDYLNDDKRAKVSFSEMARQLGYPKFGEPTENPLRLLAELPLPIYITTSHHQFLQNELIRTGHKKPETELLYWHDGLKRIPSIFAKEPDYVPSVERPLVYHLYGLDEYPESLVLTEDDFLDFLVKLSSLTHEVKHADKELDVPAVISMALSGTALLLLGYYVTSWEFRVIFKGLVQETGESRNKRTPKSISMQLDPASDQGAEAKKAEIRAYLSTFFEQSHFSVYWGDMRSCVADLWKLWKGA